MTTTPEGAAAQPRRTKLRLGPLGSALDRRIDRLQRDYRAGVPLARANLARLRRGLGKTAGSVPEIWDLTVGLVPEKLSGDDEPSRAEQAAHAALTLFALHQQSLSVDAHVPDLPIGRAVGLLRSDNARSEEAVTRRFMAVATAESMDEVLVHVRGLVTQLRTARRGFDYAAFADDLTGLLNPARAKTVRLAWGRQFYRAAPDSDAGTDENESHQDSKEETATL